MLSTVKIAGVASLLTIFGLGTANAADILVPPPEQGPVNTIVLKISGQVNRAILYGDNGREDGHFFVDSDNSGTRFRFVASGRLNDDITAGATIELQYESNSSPDIFFGNNGGTGGTNLGGGARGVGERIGEVWFNSASMGKISLGQGNTATNGTAETDLSGTGLAHYSLGSGGAEGLTFTNGVKLSGYFTNLDGGSRRDRLRYDTPTFAGFRVSVSFSEGGRYDGALRYANQFPGARIAASIGYQSTSAVSGTFDNRVSGSASVLLDNGFNLTFAAADEGFKVGGSRSYFYGKVGFQTNSVSMYGKTSFSIDYYEGDDINGPGTGDSTAYGFGIVQKLDPIATELYFNVENHEVDAVSNDVISAFVGARVKF